MILGELNVPITRLKGVGPATARDLAKLGVTNISQLLLHFPRDYVNRRDEVTFRQAISTVRAANTVGIVTEHSHFGFGKRRTLKLHVKDREGTDAEIPCFNRPFLEKSFPPGKMVWIYGTLSTQFHRLQLNNFELDEPPPGYELGKPLGESGTLVPIYPLSGSLNQTLLAKMVRQAFHDYVVELEDEIPASIRIREKFIPFRQALEVLHFPLEPAQLIDARKTLIYREFFHLQTAVLRRSLSQKAVRRNTLILTHSLRQEFLNRLPFSLTEDQVKVIGEIDSDLSGEVPMARLLQGDVGSGKTLVAFVSALSLIQAGYQCALMAPTELLALQHAENAAKLLDPLGVKIAFLSGNLRAAGRNLLLEELAAGRIDFVVGTHALFSQNVTFKNLRYVLIDEQHRFGVVQRQALMQKGEAPDLLLMSATPIPRTLALTAFGDLKTSLIKTMPIGRKPIVTHTNKQENQQKVYEFVRQELAAGHQAYFVYPLIESSESLDLKDAETMAEHLAALYPQHRVGLIHSKLDEEEKRAVMEDFSAGAISVLVATSVVEVGVDVGNATCMVIEHAERFGLSALHQLRGRVGRSALQSYCFLVYSENLTDDAKARIKVMMETTDGFRVSEEDLKIRGPGDITGMKQSGYLKLRIADLASDMNVLLQARDDVQTLLKDDSGFLLPENAPLRKLWEKAPPFNDELVAL